jgi:hypothetical protein
VDRRWLTINHARLPRYRHVQNEAPWNARGRRGSHQARGPTGSPAWTAAIIAENSGTATDGPRVSPGPDVGGAHGGGGSHLYFDRATPGSTPESDMPPSRRRHQSRRTCSSAQQGRVRRRVKCRQRTTSATAAHKRTVYGRSRSLCRAPPRGRGATSHHVVHWRDQMSTDARNSSRLTSARCLQPITRWPARRSSCDASSS